MHQRPCTKRDSTRDMQERSLRGRVYTQCIVDDTDEQDGMKAINQRLIKLGILATFLNWHVYRSIDSEENIRGYP
jgi:hypothetical protein